jgi:Fe-Mn family superoxide dismutase
MAIKLIPLPYPEDALEPAISAETLAVHHGKHHKGYVDKVNALTKGTALADQPLEAIIRHAAETDQTQFDQAAQVWNHGFYWHSLAPKPDVPSGDLADAIRTSFGTPKLLAEQLIDRGAEHFASGWVWLVARDAELTIETTHDADLPGSASLPLLVLDLWEHAYYLDRKNDRKAYLKPATHLLNWNFAAENLARGTRWTYPG